MTEEHKTEARMYGDAYEAEKAGDYWKAVCLDAFYMARRMMEFADGKRKEEPDNRYWIGIRVAYNDVVSKIEEGIRMFELDKEDDEE